MAECNRKIIKVEKLCFNELGTYVYRVYYDDGDISNVPDDNVYLRLWLKNNNPDIINK